MLQSIRDLIPRAVGRPGIGQSMYAANVVTVASAFFNQLFDKSADQIKVASFKNGVLTINCLNSVMANEIAQAEGKCRAFLKKKIPQAHLKTIRTRLTNELEIW